MGEGTLLIEQDTLGGCTNNKLVIYGEYIAFVSDDKSLHLIETSLRRTSGCNIHITQFIDVKKI